MNVYVCEFRGGYCGGLIVVAANSEDEAYRIVKDYIENEDYWEEEFRCYHRKDFRLLNGVTADVKTPQILSEDHYEE